MRRLRQRLALDRPELLAWAMYDWANSAMLTVVVTAVFPLFYGRVAAAGIEPELAQQRFTATTTLFILLGALVSPVIGALADVRALKKRLTLVFMCAGSAAVALLFTVERGDWVPALLLFGLANVAATASFVCYDSLLPHLARPGEIDRVSTAGYALGYIGGGTALALCLLLIRQPTLFGLAAPAGDGGSADTLPVRLAFVLVALWWIVFSIPLARRVHEPPRALEPDEAGREPALRTALTRLGETFRELSRYRQALLLLVAFLAYNDGINTIIRMAALYGQERGIPDSTLLFAILAVQFIGVPCAFAFGALAGRFGAKRLVLAALAVYAGITLLAWRMDTPAEFWTLAVLVGMVQGGAQALSRSLFASMIPRHKSGEFFGLFAVLEKFAGALGPGLFWLTSVLAGSSRHAILSVLVFFVVGAWLLAKVDVAEGQRAAQAAEVGVRTV